MSIQKQWDPAVSAFNTLDRITSLVRAATVDDVQPQAVIAAEHLGSLMIVHPQRIGQAIDALGGSNSFRLENVKLTLGLTSGGIAAQVRKSTPAIRCFLFAACLSLHLTPTEIGSFLYEMMGHAGLLETVPVSPAQLVSFVSTLEGHMKELLSREQVAATSLAPLLDILSNQTASNSQQWEPLNAKFASAICLETFQAIRSEEVSSAELSGCVSGVWIASIFSWLCPDDVSTTSKDQDEDGVHKVRICLVDSEWQLKKWYRIVDVTTIVFEDTSRPSTPLYATRSIGYNYWLSAGITVNGLTIIGHIVQELLRAAFETGMIRTRAHHASEHRPIPFRRCCSPTWVKELASLHESFGWPAAPIGDPEESQRQAKEIGAIIQAHAAKCHLKALCHPLRYPIYMELEKWVSRRSNYKSATFFDKGEVTGKSCVNLAIQIADSLFVEACYIDGSERKLRPFFMNVREVGILDCLVLHLVSTGVIVVDYFLIRSLASIDPDVNLSPKWHQNRWPLVVSAQGFVAYPLMLKTFSLSPTKAMAIVVQHGSLRWRETRYARIVEPIHGISHNRYSDELRLYESNGFPLPCTGVAEKALCSLNLSVTYERDQLLLSTEIVAKSTVDGSILFRANRFFHRAMGNIATAHIAEAEGASPTVLAAKLRELPGSYPIKLVEINDARLNNFRPESRDSSKFDTIEHDFRGVLTYTGSPSVDCLLAGTRHISCQFVIQGSASLLECVVQAHKVWWIQGPAESSGHVEYLILPTRSNFVAAARSPDLEHTRIPA